MKLLGQLFDNVLRSILLLFFFVCSALNAERLPPDFDLPIGEASQSGSTLWLAMDAGQVCGSSVVELKKGLRVFLAFQADIVLQLRGSSLVGARAYRDYRWQDIPLDGIRISSKLGRLFVRFEKLSSPAERRSVQWFRTTAKGIDTSSHDYFNRSAGGDVYFPTYYQLQVDGSLELRGRSGEFGAKPRIYQMLPRLFGNENNTRKTNGTLAENGTGKFSDLSTPVLEGFRSDGFTHIWLTGILQQATSTDYSDWGQPADDPDLLKGIAGSPYAIRDYFDVCPDYADNPARRLEEFTALASRMKAAGLSLLIDFVPNHVARSYWSDIRPNLSFGANDRRKTFFDRNNNFFYLTPEVVEGSGPLRLPSTGFDGDWSAGNADGLFDAERRHGRVTGNNVVSWTPSRGDWYETVKLNYGFDFLHPEQKPEYPSADTPRKRVPDTWWKMDAVIAYWQGLGVDGFRVDMAHMVPPEFWKWLIFRARQRQADVFFCAEAYNDDPAGVRSRDPVFLDSDGVALPLLDAGFNAVYDDSGYDTVKHVMEGVAWANDLEAAEAALGPFFFDCGLRYVENHDEERLAHPQSWGGLGMEAGRPAATSLFALSRGPVMVYHGQEVGEPGLGEEGFGGDDQRTTIFDYWSLPELNKWWNYGAADGAALSADQKRLRHWYSRLLRLLSEPAFARGNTFLLNAVNQNNPFFGKVSDMGSSGHWLQAFLRSDPQADSHYLVAVNFHPNTALRHLRIHLSESAISALRLHENQNKWLILQDHLALSDSQPQAFRVSDLLLEGIYLKEISSLDAGLWGLKIVDQPPLEVHQYKGLPKGNAFIGTLPVQRLKAGVKYSLDLRRLGNPGATHQFAAETVEGVEASIDRLDHRLDISVDSSASGLKILPLSLEPIVESAERMKSSLPLAIESAYSYEFRLDGYFDAQAVFVAGEFNGWSATMHPMIRATDGWRLDLPLDSGRYRYKYVVDDVWMADLNNPKMEPDGHGGFNSIVTMGEGMNASATAATLFMAGMDERSIALQSDIPLSSVIAEALPKSGGTILLPVELSGNRAVVYFYNKIPKGTLIRIVAEDINGQVGQPVIAYAGGSIGDIRRDDIIYYAFTDRFFDGNPNNTTPVVSRDVFPAANYHGGDFEGITEKIQEGYFEELGVNVIWLAPLSRNPDGPWQEYLEPYRYYTGYHGYWPVDRFGVEPRFGGEEALRDLVDAARNKEMKIIADLVLKHVHVDNPIFRSMPHLFGKLELEDGSRNLRRWDDMPFTTWFEPFLPAYDFRNPETIRFLLEDSIYWMKEYDLDGYRLDAVKHIRPDFWWRFRSSIRDAFPADNGYFVGETFWDREGISAVVGPNMLDGQFDFPLYDSLVPCFAQGVGGFGELESALRQSERVYGRTSLMSPLVGNHDKPRFMAYADGDLPDPEEKDEEEVGWKNKLRVEDASAYEKLKLALTFIFTIDGVPTLYYGDEIGMTGAGDPDNRRMMRFGDSLSIEEQSVKAHCSLLANARRKHPALYMGSRRALISESDLYAYVRAYGSDRVVVLFNRGDTEADFDLKLDPEIENGTMKDLFSGESTHINHGRMTTILKPESSAVFILGDD